MGVPMADGSAQLLSDDLVLAIVARCPTVADVIRCAATSKPIRRGILNEPFLRSLLRDDRGDVHGPFTPSVLLGLYHKTGDPHRPLAFVPAPGLANNNYPPLVAALQPAPPNHDAGDASSCHYGSYLPVVSRRSLLVLRRRCSVSEKEHLTERHGLYPVELSVCNPTTGERWVLPPHDVFDMSHAVLDVQPLAPSAFKLLVAELTEHTPQTLNVQIFSSEEEAWGGVLYCRVARGCEFVPGPAGRPSPVVLGHTVNWLCSTDVGHRILSWRWRGNGAGGVPHKTKLVKLASSLVCFNVELCLAVLPSAKDGTAGPQALLSLIVLERGEIQVWVHKKSGSRFTWKLRHRIQGTGVARPMGVGDGWLTGKELSCFSEGSSTLFLRDCGSNTSHLLLGLENNKAVSNIKATSWDLHPAAEFCPYEIDLLSYMFLMKTY